MEHPNAFDALVGLARVTLAQGDVSAALLVLQDVLAHLGAGGTLERSIAPRLILLTCYQVLSRDGDVRASEMLASAYSELQARAATIADAALRESFINNIPEHREIVAAWSLQQASGDQTFTASSGSRAERPLPTMRDVR